MAAAMRRDFRSDFLAHDVTPVDPQTLAAYEPSSGQPVRDARRRTYITEGLMIEQPARDLRQVRKSEEEIYRRHPKPVNSVPEAPRAAAASEFFQGKYTTAQDLPPRADRVRMSERFMDPQELQYLRDREQKQKESLFKVGEELRRSQEAARRRRMEAEAQLDMLSAGHDPWSRSSGFGDKVQTTAGGRKVAPRKNFVARGSHFQAGAPGNYVDKAFCRPGAGAPNVDGAGHILARQPRNIEKGRHFQSGRGDSYISGGFGKVGPGGAPHRSKGGEVAARRESIVTKDLHHQDGDNPYHSAFGRPAPGVPPPMDDEGRVQAGRRSLLERDLHHNDAPHGGYVDQVFGKGAGSLPERDQDGRVKAGARRSGHESEPAEILGQRRQGPRSGRRRGVPKMEQDPEFHDRMPSALDNLVTRENGGARAIMTRRQSNNISDGLLSQALNNVQHR